MTAGRKLFAAFVAGMAAVILAVGLVATQGTPAAAAPAAMPMLVTDTHVVLTPTTISRTPGATLTTTSAVTLGHKFANEGRTFIYLANGYTDTITATFAVPVLIDGLPVTSLAVPVVSGTTKLVGPFPVDLYNQAATESRNKVYLDYSGVTSVTVAAFTLPQK